MAKHLARICPKCRGFVGIVVNEPERKSREAPIYGFCLSCGHRITWKLILGKRTARSQFSRLLPRLGRP